MQPRGGALSSNPIAEVGVGGMLACWHEAVAKLHLELAQLLELVAPFRVLKIIIISSFKLCCIETWLFLVFALAISSLVLAFARSSLPRPLLCLLWISLAHDEC